MSRSKKKRGCNPLIAILIIGCVLLAALVVGLFGGKMALEKWLQGDGFQEWVRKTAAEKLDANVKVDTVSWKGRKVSIDSVSGHGYEEAKFAKFEVNGSRAQLNGLGKVVKVSDINITRAIVELSKDRLIRPARPVGDAAAEPAEPPKVPGFLKSFVPEKVELGDIIVGTVSLKVKDDDGKLVASIDDSSAQITPNLDNQSAAFKVKKGKVKVTDAPDMEIIEARMRWQDKSLFVKDAGINIYGDGHISGVGEIDFNSTPKYDLDLQLSSIDVKEVLPEKWKKRISGTVRGPVKVKGTSENLVQEGTVFLDKGVIEGIPVLQQIANFTKSNRFSRIVLNDAQSDFTRRGETLELRNINIHSNNLIKIQGKIDKQGENLSGVIQLGVAPNAIRLLPGKEKVFTESKDGLIWTPVTIGGTTEKMTEDLSKRILGAATSGLIGDLPPELMDQLGGLLGLKKDKVIEEKQTEAQPERKDVIRGLIEGAIEKNVDEESDIGKALKRFGPLFKR